MKDYCGEDGKKQRECRPKGNRIQREVNRLRNKKEKRREAENGGLTGHTNVSATYQMGLFITCSVCICALYSS